MAGSVRLLSRSYRNEYSVVPTATNITAAPISKLPITGVNAFVFAFVIYFYCSNTIEMKSLNSIYEAPLFIDLMFSFHLFKTQAS